MTVLKTLSPLIPILLLLAQPSSLYSQQTAAASPVVFTDVTRQAGINWVHDNALSPERYLPETVGAGCVFFDYDNDGWMDIYLVNSGPSITTITTERLLMLPTKLESQAARLAWAQPRVIMTATVGSIFM